MKLLDPFAGSGIELNPDYAEMACRLISDDNPMFNALPYLEPEPVSLFGQVEESP